MLILWRIERGTVNDIIAEIEEPKPKYTSVATFIKILENKGFVTHEALGKSYRYYPAVAREEYAKGRMSALLGSYFDGSLARMVSFFSEHENLSMEEMNEILDIMQKAKK